MSDYIIIAGLAILIVIMGTILALDIRQYIKEKKNEK